MERQNEYQNRTEEWRDRVKHREDQTSVWSYCGAALLCPHPLYHAQVPLADCRVQGWQYLTPRRTLSPHTPLSHPQEDTLPTHSSLSPSSSLPPLSCSLSPVWLIPSSSQVLMENTFLNMLSHLQTFTDGAYWLDVPCILSCLKENWQCLSALRGVKSILLCLPKDRECKPVLVLTCGWQLTHIWPCSGTNLLDQCQIRAKSMPNQFWNQPNCKGLQDLSQNSVAIQL